MTSKYIKFLDIKTNLNYIAPVQGIKITAIDGKDSDNFFIESTVTSTYMAESFTIHEMSAIEVAKLNTPVDRSAIIKILQEVIEDIQDDQRTAARYKLDNLIKGLKQ
jgi:hypothetical protein